MKNDFWNWLGWLWVFATVELFWLLPVIVFALAWVALWRHRRHRVSWETTRRLQQESAMPGRGPGLAGSRRWMILGDGMTGALRWRLARVQRLIGGLAARLAAVEIRVVELAPALNELRLAAGELGPTTATLSPELAAKLYIGLYLGDCAVAAGILMANNAQLPLVLAAVTSLAIATCQFAVGKLLGQALTEYQAEHRARRSALVGPLVVLMLLGVSLAALLHHLGWSWMFLSVTPAIGAAALTVASHDPARQRYHRAKCRMRAPRRQSLRAFRRLGRAIGRASGAWTQAAALTTRGILAPQLAEAAAADMVVVGADLTARVRGIDSMLQDIEMLRLRGGFDEVTARLGALLDQLAQVTAVHFDTCRSAPIGQSPPDHASALPALVGPGRTLLDPPADLIHRRNGSRANGVVQ